ncbi:MAG: cysteine--tRNA ligase [Oligoflexales bacterium]|nr:cysteine--tRNA ligase [Oligoflexales bacterium]
MPKALCMWTTLIDERLMQERIVVRNSLTGNKEPFSPLEKDLVRIYACGVTPYDECHIGHAMQAIFFDVIRNYLECFGYKVIYVRNFTDVDDKIIARAKANGLAPNVLAERMIASSDEDMKALGVRKASHEPKVSENIPEIQAMIHTLLADESAYVSSTGDVYFRVTKKDDYGKLSNRKTSELRSRTRELTGSEEKEDPLDFALWKRDETEGASWDSPWGKGRPGWHIECSAMAKKYLGASFDIHGGGRDLIFPHHENEIAQSEAANHAAYASVWMHSGLLTVEQQKMSKSLGNFITIKAFLRDWHPEVLRFSYLQNHYGSNIDFSLDTFKQCRRRLFYYYETLIELDQRARTGAESANKDLSLAADERSLGEFLTAMHSSMRDDFNTAGAWGEINKLFRWLNQKLSQKDGLPLSLIEQIQEKIKEISRIFGVLKEVPQSFVEEQRRKILLELGFSSESEIETAIKERALAREEKDWAKGDKIRDQLAERGIVLKDKGTALSGWTFKF